MSRNHDPAKSHPGEYSTDLISAAAVGFLDDAIKASDRPFFLGVAPIAPHSETVVGSGPAQFNAPVPAKRHEHLFTNVTVPRTPNFNPNTVCHTAIYVTATLTIIPDRHSILLQNPPPTQPNRDRLQRRLVPQASPIPPIRRRAHRLHHLTPLRQPLRPQQHLPDLHHRQRLPHRPAPPAPRQELQHRRRRQHPLLHPRARRAQGRRADAALVAHGHRAHAVQARGDPAARGL